MHWAPRLRCFLVGLALTFVGVGPGLLAQSPSTSGVQATRPAITLPPQEAQRAFTALLRSFFEAYTAKNIEAMASFWHPNGPARYRRNVVLVEFDMRQIAMAGLTVQDASADPGGGKARAILELAVTEAKTGRTRTERRVRDFTFLPDDTGAWRIWNEVSPARELARDLLAVPAAEREAFVAARPEYASDDVLNGLSVEAGRLQGEQKYDLVLDALETQSRLARSLGNDDTVGRSLISIGSLRMMTGRYPEAAAAFTSARDAFDTVGNSEDVAACDANLANIAYIQGRITEAADRYQRAYEIFERLNDDARMANSLQGLGNTSYMLTEFTKALDYYTRAITVLQRVKDTSGQGAVLQAMALVHRELGDYGPAADAWRRSLVITEAGGDRPGSAKAYAGLGEVYRLQGDLGRALEHHGKALAIWEQLKSPAAIAGAHYAVGQVFALQRNFTRAIESYEKALAIDVAIKDDPATSESGQARELGGMAGAHFAMNQPEIALGEYERSLALREKLKDEAGAMWTLAHMGVLHASQRRFDEAAKAYGASLAIADARSDQNARSTLSALRGQLEFDQERDAEALASASAAAEVATAIEHFDTVMFAKVVVGRVHQKAGRVAEARAAYEEAVAATAKIPIGPAAETFFDNRRAPFVALVDLLATHGNGGEAFRWSERARLDALSEMLGGDGSVVVKGLSREEREQERSIGSDLRALNAKVRRERGRQKPDAERLAALQKEAALKQSERDELRKRLFEAHPALRHLRGLDDPLEPAAAAGLLGTAPAAVVSFVVTEARTWAFGLAKDATSGAWGVQKTVSIDMKSADLAQMVRQFREAIGRKEDRAEELSRELSGRLLEPLQPVLAGKSRLLVVPDAFLWSLPFEALRSADGRFVVESLTVSYLPSLTALLALAATTPASTGPRSLLAVGQPMLASDQLERLALLRPAALAQATSAGGAKSGAPQPPPAPSSAPQSPVRSGDSASVPSAAALAAPAPPRPAPDPEIQAISTLFPLASRKTYVWDKATADRVGDGAAAGSFLHLALPIVLTEAAPLYTTLAFTPDPAAPGSGLVEAYGLMSANLPAGVVVASRVEYGPASGEGDALRALAWMFLVAGSPALVLNRWMPGPGDPNLAVRFARAHAAAPVSSRAPRPSDSLQKAMKGILAQPATRHPYYWAGYLVVGR